MTLAKKSRRREKKVHGVPKRINTKRPFECSDKNLPHGGLISGLIRISHYKKGDSKILVVARHWRSRPNQKSPVRRIHFQVTRMNKALRLLRKSDERAPGHSRRGKGGCNERWRIRRVIGLHDGKRARCRRRSPGGPGRRVKAEAVPRGSRSEPSQRQQPAVRVRWPASATAFIALALAVAGLIWVYQQLIPVDAAVPRLAKLNIVTEPAGIDVIINGELKGVSPLSVSLAAGAQTVTLRQGTEERVVPLTLTAGAEVTHHIEFAPRAAAAAPLGSAPSRSSPTLPARRSKWTAGCAAYHRSPLKIWRPQITGSGSSARRDPPSALSR